MRWRTLNRRKARLAKRMSAAVKPVVWAHPLYLKNADGSHLYVGRVHLPDGAFAYEGEEYRIAHGPLDLLSLTIDGVTVPLSNVNAAARFEVGLMDWPDALEEVE